MVKNIHLHLEGVVLMLYARVSYQEGMPKLLKQGTVFNCHMKINFTISLTLFC